MRAPVKIRTLNGSALPPLRKATSEAIMSAVRIMSLIIASRSSGMPNTSRPRSIMSAYPSGPSIPKTSFMAVRIASTGPISAGWRRQASIRTGSRAS